MGASSSQMGRPRPSHHRPNRRLKRSLSSFFTCGRGGAAAASVSSFFICGAASSSASNFEIEDGPAELIVNSAERGDVDKFPAPRKNLALSCGTRSGLITPKSDNGVTSERSVLPSENHQLGDGSADAEARIRGKYSSESKELVPPDQSISDSHCGETASPSYMDQPSVDPASTSKQRAYMDVNDANISMNRDVSPGPAHHGSSPSTDDLGDCSSDESSIGNHVTVVMTFQNYDSTTASAVSDSPLNNHLTGDDTLLEAGPAGLGMLASGRELDSRDGSALQHDAASVSSSVVSSSSSELNSESRRNGRRLFWDAFPRRARMHTDSESYLFPNENSDHLAHHDRWLLDFTGDFLGEGVGGDFRSYGNRTQGNYERRWHTRSQILERIRGGLDGNSSQTSVCPTRIHPEGSCSCESVLRAEESGPRASISRIVMLAEALFEVLDEIHRQPLSASLPAVSLPAPESVVDSFPVKNYGKPERLESVDDVAKCYICLAEYEEGDKIRVLPCDHEYHVPCIDKWLKEIHGVCPLCRRDVREGLSEGSASTSEIPSL